ALALEFLFSLAYPGNLRCGIDHPRHRLQIHMSGLARDHLGYRHPLFRGLVREHRTAHYVADRVDVGQIGAAVIIDFDEAAAIQLETDAFGAEVRRHGRTPHRDDQHIEFGFLLADRIGILDGHAVFRLLDRAYFHPEPDIQSDHLGEYPQRFLGDLLVCRLQEIRQRLEDG